MLVNNRSTWQKKEHPYEEGTWFTLRPLTDDEYQAALDARFDQVIVKARNMGAELSKSLRDEQREASTEAATNPMASIHAATAIKYAVTEWSYAEECNDENKLLLDKGTQEWLKEVIVEMNGPRPLATSPASNGNSKTGQSQHKSETPIESGP